MQVAGSSVLLIIGGGIAAYKALELVRLLQKANVGVEVILTEAGTRFVTPLSVSALCGRKVRQDLWEVGDEAQMGHIQLSRSADLVVVAPATADLIAKAANGLADDLASTALLATDKPVLMAPAMNVRMWFHPATRRNVETLIGDGVIVVGPEEGPMACGEFGEGRLAEPEVIAAAVLTQLQGRSNKLQGRKILVTAGPTLEPIDPVRVLANRSSGRQGYAIAEALAELGADVVLVSGPTSLASPPGVARRDVETAREMLAACQAALPVDVAVLVAAVADWRPQTISPHKLKKAHGAPECIKLVENPDILARISAPGPARPRLVVGFAAETENLEAHARSKLANKGCDWIVANDVTLPGVMGGDDSEALLVTASGLERWPRASKRELARRLAVRIGDALA